MQCTLEISRYALLLLLQLLMLLVPALHVLAAAA
jgi:hypothetical protein